jgi:hypothetical protein
MFRLARVGVILAQTVAQAGLKQALFCKQEAADQAAAVQLELLATVGAMVVAAAALNSMAVAAELAVIQALVALAARVAEPNLLLVQEAVEAAAEQAQAVLAAVELAY